MSVSDKINILLCVLSFFLSAISIIFVIITIRQNSHMIENATRPYIKFYGASTWVGSVPFYLVLRNFGQSSAVITGFSSSVDLSKCSILDGIISDACVPFKHIIGYTIAPNQAMRIPIDHFKLIELDKNPSFTIRYSSGKKNYTETTVINMLAHTDSVSAHAGDEMPDIKVISRVLQEMNVRQL